MNPFVVTLCWPRWAQVKFRRLAESYTSNVGRALAFKWAFDDVSAELARVAARN